MGDKEHVDAKQEQTSEEAQPAVPPAADPPPPQQPKAVATPNNPEKMSKSDRIMAAATIVIAIGTLVSSGAICFQWYEMHTGAADTKNLVVYAQRQADDADKIQTSADKQAIAAEQFAKTEDLINGNVNQAVAKLGAQAAEMDKARVSSEAQSQKALDNAIHTARMDQRAFLVVRGPDGPEFQNVLCPDSFHTYCIPIRFENVGRTPATNIHARGYIALGSPIIPPDFSVLEAQHDDPEVGDILINSASEKFRAEPNPHELTTPTGNRFESSQGQRGGRNVIGYIQYDDIFGERHETGFCQWLPESGPPGSALAGSRPIPVACKANWFDDRPSGYPKRTQ